MLKLELSTKAFTATRLEKKQGKKWGQGGGGKHSEKKQKKTNILFTPFYI